MLHSRDPAPPADDREFVTGSASFLADLAEPGTLRAGFVRSFRPHGILRGIDSSVARDLPGVIAVFTAADLGLRPLVPSDAHGGGTDGPGQMRRPPLAETRVRFVGEPIAVVVATSDAAVADAAATVWPEIDILEPLLDPRQASADGVLLFPEAGTNVAAHSMEQLGRPAGSWPVSVTVDVENQRIAATPMEPIGMLAAPGPGNGLTLWCGHQAPHSLRAAMASALDIGEDRIRVRVPSIGGAFGLKGSFHPEYVVVAAAALRLGQPVLWAATRSEELLSATHGRGQIGRLTLSGERDGRIQRADIELLVDLGGYPHSAGDLHRNTRLMATGPYDIPELTFEVTAVVTNRAPIGPYRGAGRPEAAFLLERGIDAYARSLGLDPVEVRRMNFISPEQMPWRTPTGALYDGGRYEEALDLALNLATADDVRREQAERRRDGKDPVGLGVGFYVDRSGGDINTGEYARVEIDERGRAVVKAGSMSSGQGHPTVWRQVVGRVLGLAPEQIAFIAGDTSYVRSGVGTFGSRSTQLGAAAAHRAAVLVVERARVVAADMLEAHADDLILDDGGFRVVGTPAPRVTLGEVAAQLRGRGQTLAGEETFDPGQLAYPYGAFVAVVEVSLETGEVDLRHLVAVNDCGTIVNPELATGQVLGSSAQGVGQALFERIVYNEDGQLLSSTFMDYGLPTALSVPRMTLGWLTTPAPSNPLGAKGIGESGCIGVPQAIVNATVDALAFLGVDDLQMPLDASRVWHAIQQARRLEPAAVLSGPDGDGS
jgi:aerobic carbon-monoxide dehydrogenase large subunit